MLLNSIADSILISRISSFRLEYFVCTMIGSHLKINITGREPINPNTRRTNTSLYYDFTAVSRRQLKKDRCSLLGFFNQVGARWG